MYPQDHERLRIAIAIATTGRAQVMRETLPVILDQTRPPDRVIVAVVTQADVEGLPLEGTPRVEVIQSRRGSTFQRNAALELVRDHCDVVVFFDDDFVPSRTFLERVEALFLARRDVAAVTGCLVLDGVNHGGCTLEDALQCVRAAEAAAGDAQRPYDVSRAQLWDINHLYGCNMAARLPAAAEVAFDERLPLYAWQEDRDFSRRLHAYGRIVRTDALTGAHLGVTSGRSRGLPLGYSQVANPLYLMRKGTMQPLETTLLVARNVVANVMKTWRPEPWIDRRGRVRGNLLALTDAALGRVRQERVLEL